MKKTIINPVLLVSYSEYQTKETLIGSNNNIVIILQVIASHLDEIAVIGYGGVSKRNL